MTDAERYKALVESVMDYKTTERIADKLIQRAQAQCTDADSDYDRLLWLVRSAYIEGVMHDYNGIYMRGDPETIRKSINLIKGN